MSSKGEEVRVLMIMHPADNVAVCLRPLKAGEIIPVIHTGKTLSLEVRGAVPLGHKVALSPVARGQKVIKYGETIGRALKDIAAGEHVHDHNIADYEGVTP